VVDDNILGSLWWI